MVHLLARRVRALAGRAATLVAGLCEFQQRIWVVSIVWGCVAVPTTTSTTVYHR